jgi:hypothetical protein
MSLSYNQVVGRQLCFVSFHTGFLSEDDVQQGMSFDKSQVKARAYEYVMCVCVCMYGCVYMYIWGRDAAGHVLW